MGFYIMLNKNSKRSNKTIIPLALVGYEMIIANSGLRASLAIYYLSSWNNCQIASIWRENMLGYLSTDIAHSEKRSVFRVEKNCEL